MPLNVQQQSVTLPTAFTVQIHSSTMLYRW